MQQNLYKYFYPARRSKSRRACDSDRAVLNPIKHTPKTSRIGFCKKTNKRKRSHSFRLSPCIKAKRTNFEECLVDQNVRSSEGTHLVQERPGCSYQLELLPNELEVEYSLETVAHPQESSTAFRSVSAETLCNLLTTLSEAEFNERYLLIDCRYPFEYNGGHIKGAVNVHDPKDIAKIFFPADENKRSYALRKIPIFYCEFSQKRGPGMAHNLRAFDRARNERRYPEVDYREIYLLDRGYSAFYRVAKNLNLCEPNAYTKMIDSRHARELRKYSFHRTKTMASFDLTISKDRSTLFSRCNRKRLHYAKMGLPRSCMSLDDTSPGAKNEKKVSFVLCADEDFDDSSSDCGLSKLSESPTQFQQLNLSGTFDDFLIS